MSKSQAWEASPEPLFSLHQLEPNVSLHLLKDDTQKVVVLDSSKDNDEDNEKKVVITPQVSLIIKW
jgi:hypothetical protein